MSNIQKPELMFTGEVKEFHPFEDEMLSMEVEGNLNIEQEMICKVQSFDDLKNLRHILSRLVRIEDGCHSPLGYKCHLFLENGEIKVKTVRENVSDRKFSTSLGEVICSNLGEWGGALILITDEGEQLFLESHRHPFVDVFEYDGKVFVISSLAHMSSYHCGLHEIGMSKGKYVLKTVFESWEMYFSGYYVEGNWLYFYSNFPFTGLGRINLDDSRLEGIERDLCQTVQVSGMVKKDDFIYIYGNYNIIEYDLNSRKIVSVYTNLEPDEIDEFWFVGKDEKLIDVWDEYVIDGE